MDTEAAAFVLDRMDMARVAILEAKQTIEKFAQPEDAAISKLLDEMLAKVEQVDAGIRASSYPAAR